MSLSIQGNCNCLFAFNRTLSHEDVQRAIDSSSKEEAAHVGIWEKIYELTHNNDEPDTEFILKKSLRFNNLRK